ncbi:MAG: hypothetical protein OXN21_15855 [Chloroflexota bacterium]|nr:hypothetical protein [Chloroflexota bacterium]
MPRMTAAEKLQQIRELSRDRHPVFRTRKVGGMAVATGISHLAGEEPPDDMKHLYAQVEDGTWVRKRLLERMQELEREIELEKEERAQRRE